MKKSLNQALIATAKKLDQHHKTIASTAEHVSMTAGVAAGIAAAGATIAAPTGIAAIGVWLGLTSAPVLVTAAPILGAVATAAGTVSGITYFYSKWKKNQQRTPKSDAHNNADVNPHPLSDNNSLP